MGEALVMYAYLVYSSLFIIPWLILFILRKDLRKEMLITSIFIAGLGVIVEWLWYTKDWVKPLTITQTRVGIEDFILGFGAGGIASVIYKKEVFHKTVNKSVSLNNIRHWVLALPLLLAAGTAHLLFAYFGWFSFWANVVGVGLGLFLMSLLRKDLEKEALEGGLLLTIVTVPIYWITFFIFPTWVRDYWNYENVSGFLILGIPYEDLLWWVFVGALMAILYDYWALLKLKKLPK